MTTSGRNIRNVDVAVVQRLVEGELEPSAIVALRQFRAQIGRSSKGTPQPTGWIADLSDPVMAVALFPFGDYTPSRGLARQPQEYIELLDRLMKPSYAKVAWRKFDHVVAEFKAPDHRRRSAADLAVPLFHEIARLWFSVHNEDRATDSERRRAAETTLKRARALIDSLDKHPEFRSLTGILVAVREPVALPLHKPPTALPTGQPMTFAYALGEFIERLEVHIQRTLDDPDRTTGQPRTIAAIEREFARGLSHLFISGLGSPQDAIVGALAAAAFDHGAARSASWVKSLRATARRSAAVKRTRRTRVAKKSM